MGSLSTKTQTLTFRGTVAICDTYTLLEFAFIDYLHLSILMCVYIQISHNIVYMMECNQRFYSAKINQRLVIDFQNLLSKE